MLFPMNSAYNRAYSLFYMTVTAFLFVSGFASLYAHLYKMNPKISFDVVSISPLTKSSRGFDESYFNFSISADFSNCIHANAHLFYAYIIAEWIVGKTDKHSSILWNYLIDRENPVVKFDNVGSNFTLRQVGPSMVGKEVKLTFRYQFVPYIGFFKTVDTISKVVTLPTKKIG